MKKTTKPVAKKCTCGARPWEYEPCYCGKGVQPEDYYGMVFGAMGIKGDIPREGKARKS